MLSVFVSSHWKCESWRLDARHRRLVGFFQDFMTGTAPPFSQWTSKRAKVDHVTTTSIRSFPLHGYTLKIEDDKHDLQERD